MFKTSWTIGRVRGIPVRLHVSLLIIVPLIAWTVAARDLPRVVAALGLNPNALVLPPVFWGLMLALAIFAGVALHELGHALVALRQGGKVRAITLMLLGGVTEIEHEEATPRQQAWMAFAGPLVSFLLGGVSLAATLIPGMPVDAYVALVLFGHINLVLALFNLVPAYPLDGGRILRALFAVWMDPTRATRFAANVGRVLAALGLAMVTMNPMLFLVAAFIYFGAGMEEAAITMRASLAGLTARQAMVNRVVTVEPERPLPAVARHMLLHGAAAAIVRDQARIRGVLVPRDLRRPRGTAGEAMSGEALFVRAEDDLGHVAKLIQKSPQGGAIVFDAFNTIVGVVTYEELARTLALKSAAGVRTRPTGGRRVEASEEQVP